MGTDFIALLKIGAAASWFRASTKAEALEGLAKQARLELRKVIRLKAGQPVRCTLIDCTGWDHVSWEGERVFVSNGQPSVYLSDEKITRQTITLA